MVIIEILPLYFIVKKIKAHQVFSNHTDADAYGIRERGIQHLHGPGC